MKKTLLGILSVIILAGTIGSVYAKAATTSAQTAQGIKMYKSGNYTQSYLTFNKIVDMDPSNALAAYYLGMSAAQLGKADEAVAAYEKAMNLSPKGILGRYAKQGKKCVETPLVCHEPIVDDDDTEEDKFIKSGFGFGFSEKARGVYEKQKIENIKRDINRYNDIAPQKFRDYKDFSSQAPTYDEIVSALKTLQRAGFGDMMGGNRYGYDIAALTGDQQSGNNANYDMLNLLFSNNGGTSNLNPQVIQSLLTNQMAVGF